MLSVLYFFRLFLSSNKYIILKISLFFFTFTSPQLRYRKIQTFMFLICIFATLSTCLVPWQTRTSFRSIKFHFHFGPFSFRREIKSPQNTMTFMWNPFHVKATKHNVAVIQIFLTATFPFSTGNRTPHNWWIFKTIIVGFPSGNANQKLRAQGTQLFLEQKCGIFSKFEEKKHLFEPPTCTLTLKHHLETLPWSLQNASVIKLLSI